MILGEANDLENFLFATTRQSLQVMADGLRNSVGHVASSVLTR